MMPMSATMPNSVAKRQREQAPTPAEGGVEES
jgi:hypothetical protein